MANSLDDILSPEFGAALQAAREKKHLQIEDAATKLRMNPVFIEHMERGNFHLLPPEPYRKGFIKSYAQLVDVKLTAPLPPPEKRNVISTTVAAVKREAVDLTKEVVETTVKTTGTVVQKFEVGVKDTFEEITSRDLWVEADEVRKERLGKQKTDDPPIGFSIRKRESTTDQTSANQSDTRRSYVAPLSVSEPPVVEEYEDEAEPYDYGAEHHGMSRSTKTIVGLLIVIAGIFAYSIISKKAEPPAISTVQDVAVEEPSKQRAKKEEAVVVPPQEVQVDSSAIAGTSDSLTFSITAKDSVWLSVTPDIGSGGFRGKMKVGETRTFIANKKFLVFIGNQKAVTMKLDGEKVSGLPTVENSSLVVRNVVLTKDEAYIKPEGERIFDSKPSSGTVIPATKQVKKPTVRKKPTPNIKRTIPNVQPVLPDAN